MTLRTRIFSGYLAIAVMAVFFSVIIIGNYDDGILIGKRLLSWMEAQLPIPRSGMLLATLSVIYMIVSLGLGFLMSNRVISVVNKVNHMACAILTGDYTRRISVGKGRDELDALVRSFNKVCDRFEENMRILHEFEQKYVTSVEYASDGVVILQDEKFVFCNKAFSTISGYSIEELQYRHVYDDILSPNVVNAASKRYREVMEGKVSPKIGEIQIICKDGSIKYLEINSAVIEYNKEKAILCILRDTSERRDYQQKLRRLSEQVIQTQEEERKRISHELHDEIGQILTAININMDFMDKHTELPVISENFTKICAEIKRLINKGIDDIHRICYNLRPHLLDDVGFVSALRWFIEHLHERTAIQIELQVDDQLEHLSPFVETLLYRVAQEALTNVLRHAEATHILIQFRSSPKDVRLVIQDDGKGFNVEDALATDNRTGLGIFGMQERISTFGGKLFITSKQPGGTRLVVELPGSYEVMS